MTKAQHKWLTQYTPPEVLAISFEVFAEQGFIKSGHGYSQPTGEFDSEDNQVYTQISDNKTCILRKMQAFKSPAEKYQVAQKHIDSATKEIDRINGKLLMKKLGGNLSNFEDGLIKAIEGEVSNFHVSIIASIPNSILIDAKRQALGDRMSTLKHTSQYVGKKGLRLDINVDVLDVKFIQSSDVYMITAVSDKRDIVKFWWREQPDLTDIIERKTISIRGTVNKQEISKYSDARETLFNRVKISLIN